MIINLNNNIIIISVQLILYY